MNKANTISTHSNLDRRAVLKVAAGASALAMTPCGFVSAAVLANNNEIVALTARAAVDYIRRGELSAERYAHAKSSELRGGRR